MTATLLKHVAVKNDLQAPYDTSLHHLVYQMMNLWLALLAYYHLVYHDHIFFHSCALSFLLPCFGSRKFLKVYISQGSAATRFGCGEIFDDFLSQIFQRVCQ